MNTCQQIMTENPACCLATDKVYTIAQRMQNDDIGSIPVVSDHDSKRLIGIVTDRDLALRVVGASRDATSTLVSDVMTHNPVVCHETDDLNSTLEVMARHQIRRIPVVDASGCVVGIIAQADVALHLEDSNKVGEMIEQISQPIPSAV